MKTDAYRRLAQRLDELPNGFPAAPSGSELRLLARLYTPEEAELASSLRLTQETAEQLAERLGGDPAALRKLLKGMARRGLITVGRTPDGLAFGLMPFVVGVWEAQGSVLDAELARLFEEYYQEAFHQALTQDPPVHRVVPVGESVNMDMVIGPTETIVEIIDRAQSWGVLDCICRKELELLGKPCGHPLDVCMAMSEAPNAFPQEGWVRGLTREEALATLKRAADAGLVHTVSNNQKGVWYVCNCCTCGCGILRGLAELGIADVVARSPYVNQVDEDRCVACGICVDLCQFGALELADVVQVDGRRCVGCGVCVPVCPQEALALVPRPASEVTPPPETMMDWLKLRAERRGIDLNKVL
jgi:NAD-dependent dihydropyrimidine dehydrogenase PreA subunit